MEESTIKFPSERLAYLRGKEEELDYKIEDLESELEYLDHQREGYRIRIEEIMRLSFNNKKTSDTVPKTVFSDLIKEALVNEISKGIEDLLESKPQALTTWDGIIEAGMEPTSEFNKRYSDKVVKEINPNAIKAAVKKFEDRKSSQNLNVDMDAYINMLMDAETCKSIDEEECAEIVAHKRGTVEPIEVTKLKEAHNQQLLYHLTNQYGVDRVPVPVADPLQKTYHQQFVDDLGDIAITDGKASIVDADGTHYEEDVNV